MFYGITSNQQFISFVKMGSRNLNSFMTTLFTRNFLSSMLVYNYYWYLPQYLYNLIDKTLYNTSCTFSNDTLMYLLK